MKSKTEIIIGLIMTSLVWYNQGFCLDGKDIVRLESAGIDDNTLQTIIRERVVETCAFTVQEILDLKKSGMRNETIRVVVESASFVKDNDPIEYGDDIRSIRFTSPKDLICLKNAGISDEVIETIVSGTKKENDDDYTNAWEMLKNMGIIIDERDR